jgi:glycosyltransferase involved in cell wall biosynthesis
MPSVAVVILTQDEALHVGRAIDSVSGFAAQIFIVDSGSTDRTVEIAQAKGATVVYNSWTSHARQFQWALDNLQITADWILRLDADEIIEADLGETLLERLGALPNVITGVNLKRKHIFLGRWIKHGGRYPVTLLRIWRRGVARIEDRWMDEHAILKHGEAETFEGGFADANLKDITFFVAKHNSYATLEAVEVLTQRLGLFTQKTETKHASVQAASKRAIKEHFYSRLPFGFGPVGYFLYRYFIQLGFLDGVEGAIYHGLQGLWYRYLVDVKILELSRAIDGLLPAEALRELARLTKLKLVADT